MNAVAALREIYDRDHPALHSFLVKLTLGDVALAEDLAQETFLRAWRHLVGRADVDLQAVRPWLYTVARRLVVDHLRARSARPPETFMEDLTGVPVVEDPIGLSLAASAIEDALGDLLPEHREVLVGLYFQGRTPVQVAGGLGIPVGTVKSRSHYAKRALLARLEG